MISGNYGSSLPQSKCNIRNCKYYRGTRLLDLSNPSTEVHYCSVFREGVPEDISYGDNEHLTPMEGQVDPRLAFMVGTNPDVVIPYSEEDMLKPRNHSRDNLCSTIRDIYIHTEDEKVRLWCRLAMTMSKNSYVATQKYCKMIEDLGFKIRASRDDWQLRAEIGKIRRKRK